MRNNNCLTTNSTIKEKKRMTLRIKNTEVGFENYTWIGKKRRISFIRQRDEKVDTICN